MKIKEIEKPVISEDKVSQLQSIFTQKFLNADGTYDYFSIGRWIAQCVIKPVKALSGFQTNIFEILTAMSQTQTGAEIQQSPNFALLKGFISNCEVSTKIGSFLAGFIAKREDGGANQ